MENLDISMVEPQFATLDDIKEDITPNNSATKPAIRTPKTIQNKNNIRNVSRNNNNNNNNNNSNNSSNSVISQPKGNPYTKIRKGIEAMRTGKSESDKILEKILKQLRLAEAVFPIDPSIAKTYFDDEQSSGIYAPTISDCISDDDGKESTINITDDITDQETQYSSHDTSSITASDTWSSHVVSDSKTSETKKGCLQNLVPGLTFEPEKDRFGLPLLKDKSKYKAVGKEYCQLKGWSRPIEQTQNIDIGFRATVTFGDSKHLASASGDGLSKKAAIYDAYKKLIPSVIPRHIAIQLMIKFVPGFDAPKSKVLVVANTNFGNPPKHPKSLVIEWANKHNVEPPISRFGEEIDHHKDAKKWKVKVNFMGQTVTRIANKKKDAELLGYQQLFDMIKKGIIKTPN